MRTLNSFTAFEPKYLHKQIWLKGEQLYSNLVDEYNVSDWLTERYNFDGAISRSFYYIFMIIAINALI